MPTNFTLGFTRKSEIGVQIAKDQLDGPMFPGRAFSACFSFKKVNIIDWRSLLRQFVNWIHNKQAEKNTALYEDALRREQSGLPPRWR